MPLTAKYHPETSLLLVPITRPTPFTSRRDKREKISPGARQAHKLQYTWLQQNGEKTTSRIQQRSIRPVVFIEQLWCTYTKSMERKDSKRTILWITRSTVKAGRDQATTREQYILRTTAAQDKAYPKEYHSTIVQPMRTCIEFFNNQIDNSNDQPKKQPRTQKRTCHYRKNKHQGKTEQGNTFIFSIIRIQDYTIYRMTKRRNL